MIGTARTFTVTLYDNGVKLASNTTGVFTVTLAVGSHSLTATQSGGTWTIQLDHPMLGHAVIVLNQGPASSGGAVGYSAGGVPTALTPLLDHVQAIQVTDNGPVWGA